jgi:hypothetical protein
LRRRRYLHSPEAQQVVLTPDALVGADSSAIGC